MKIRVAVAALYVVLLCGAAFAQEYHIRVSQNTNLRASDSLESVVLASARAGTILEVVGRQERWLRVKREGRVYWMAGWVNHTRVGEPEATPEPAPEATPTVAIDVDIDNCCFVNRQCATYQDWEAGYWAFLRNECPVSQPATSATAPVSPPADQTIDNCCFVNRQCATYQDWEAGYWAFLRNECPVNQPATSATAPASTPADQAVDNCCFVNRQCASEQEWVDGYHAFQYDNSCQNKPPAAQSGAQASGRFTCQAPSHSHPVGIFGHSEFKNTLGCALDLLKRKGGRWYGYVVSALKSIRPRGGTLITVYPHSREVFWGTDGWSYWSYNLVAMAGFMVHEACHVHYKGSGNELAEESECLERELQALRTMGASRRWIRDVEKLLQAIRDDPKARWWGHD